MLSDDMKLLRQRIRKFRKAQGLSQGQLEVRIGKERNYITRVETGRIEPPLEVVSRIAEELDRPIGALFSEDESDQDLKILRKRVLQLVKSAETDRLRLLYRIIQALDQENALTR